MLFRSVSQSRYNPEGGGQSTIIYGGQTGVTWFVEEGVEEVVKRVNNSKSWGSLT